MYEKKRQIVTLSSFSSQDVNEEGKQSPFYKQFIKSKRFQSADITQTSIKEQQNGKAVSAYASYKVTINTLDIEYSIARRYSAFRELYERIGKKSNIKTEFPTKTLFTSSLNEAVINKRRAALNCFIAEVLKLDKEQALVELFEFLDIRKMYVKEHIELPADKDSEKKLDEDVILELMIKLGTGQESSVNCINSLQRELFDNKLRITSEVIRQLFVGLGKRKGLLEVSLMDDDNQLQCLRGIQFVSKLLNYQQNRQAEVYIRNFVACPSKHLKISPKLLTSSQIKLKYFTILEIYFKRNCDIDFDPTVDQLFEECSQQYKKEFCHWWMSRQKSNYQQEAYDDMQHTDAIQDQIQETAKWLKDTSQDKSIKLKVVKLRQKLNQFDLRIESNGQNILKYTYQSMKSESELKPLFIDSMKWYKWVTFSRIDPFSKALNVTIQLGTTKKFKFECNIQQKQNSLVVEKYPYSKKMSPQVDRFYELVVVEKSVGKWNSKVTVWRYFDSADMVDFFIDQLEGKVDSVSQALLQ